MQYLAAFRAALRLGHAPALRRRGHEHGTRRLRVVDESAFPRIPGFFPVSAIYMMAEKAADVLLAAAPATPP
jgi:choline dehydrogenase-like flavoprotein